MPRTAGRETLMTFAKLLTPFVGRATETAALTRALERTAAGRGQTVAVVGEAGVGKSRLIYEFVHTHPMQDWRILESAALSVRQALPYAPVVNLLKRYSQVEEGDEPRTIQTKVTDQIMTLDATL